MNLWTEITTDEYLTDGMRAALVAARHPTVIKSSSSRGNGIFDNLVSDGIGVIPGYNMANLLPHGMPHRREFWRRLGDIVEEGLAITESRYVMLDCESMLSPMRWGAYMHSWRKINKFLDHFEWMADAVRGMFWFHQPSVLPERYGERKGHYAALRKRLAASPRAVQKTHTEWDWVHDDRFDDYLELKSEGLRTAGKQAYISWFVRRDGHGPYATHYQPHSARSLSMKRRDIWVLPGLAYTGYTNVLPVVREINALSREEAA